MKRIKEEHFTLHLLNTIMCSLDARHKLNSKVFKSAENYLPKSCEIFQLKIHQISLIYYNLIVSKNFMNLHQKIQWTLY